jgi:hypothetical protein
VAERIRQKQEVFMRRDQRVNLEVGPVSDRIAHLVYVCDSAEQIDITLCYCFKKLEKDKREANMERRNNEEIVDMLDKTKSAITSTSPCDSAVS